ncbi:hypothetical protein [Paraferrimonas sp. SM1919]|uniref:hypothetical protein n=1 Tax=Paraferrimonas sp. SM1919 TaxID=2662263 RepID=UPI0013D1ECA5|nr:hypothetical protein [Paraferrimonas sp. SM1919]
MTSLFTPSQIKLGSLLGGPMASLYLLHHAMQAIGRDSLAVKVKWIGGLVIVSLLIATPFVPQYLPYIVTCFVSFLLVMLLLKKCYLTKQAIIKSQLYSPHSNWFVSYIIVTSIVLMFSLSYLSVSFFLPNSRVINNLVNDFNGNGLPTSVSILEIKASKDNYGEGIIFDFKLHADAVLDIEMATDDEIKEIALEMIDKSIIDYLLKRNIYIIFNFRGQSNMPVNQVVLSNRIDY